MNFDRIYIRALSKVLYDGISEVNGRTKARTFSIHGYSFDYDMNYLPMLHIRKTWVRSGATELAWFLSGTKDASWVNSETSIWKAFTDDEGNIPTAYGYRWSHAWGYDQINNIINRLKYDPTSRQQVLLSWDPRVDNVIPAANIPCPLMYIINIIDGRLNIHLTLRSNDAWLGLPYDVMTACLLGRALANSLGVGLGKLHYSIANLHLYENQLTLAYEAKKRFEGTSIAIPNDSKFSIEDIRQDKTAYINSFNSLNHYNYSGWKPEVDVVR